MENVAREIIGDALGKQTKRVLYLVSCDVNLVGEDRPRTSSD